MIWRLLRAILFWFDAESVHHGATRVVALLRGRKGRLLRVVSGTPLSARDSSSHHELWGMTFLNRVGLAAGFDKNAEWLPSLPHLGFGFAELGTVTPRPQAGNERPRLFRVPEREALFNRMGFNNLGAALVAERVARFRSQLPEGFRVGINIGKNKTTSNESAVDDYVAAARPFANGVDYLVINVSSPNTPGLRALQEPESLKRLVSAVQAEVVRWSRPVPVLLKIAPELGEEALGELARMGDAMGMGGWVLTNTLGGTHLDLPGGWSGRPVAEASLRSLRVMRGMTRAPIISVGGILDESEARLRIESGANLVQIYSGWVLRGPRLPSRLSKALGAQKLKSPEP